MLAVKFDSKKVVLADVPAPSGSGVRVKVRACGICGSDVTILDSGFPIFGIPGHEIAGELEDGTPVAIEPFDPCGCCRYCLGGDHQVCVKGNEMIYGVGRNGGMAEEIVVPAERLVPLPRGLDATTGFLVEPLAVAVHGVRRAGIDGSMRVLVVGGGTIGLSAVAAATAAHAQVDLVARHPAQIAAGRQLGAEIVESGQEGDYDVVLDCAGTASATAASCEALRSNGRLLMLASSWDKIELPGLIVAEKEIDIVISTMYGRAGMSRDVDVAATILGHREEVSDALISHRFPLSQAPEAFEKSRDREGGAIKIALEP
ncbi:MAG: alcohol dehydrogenase catalytic domain-containing protein [bacterium]|nr:alcohol dehydrogenase catalytic domain-containing protein [bacterium]